MEIVNTCSNPYSWFVKKMFSCSFAPMIKNVSFFYSLSTFTSLCIFYSNDEDEEVHSTDPESKEKSKDKKTLCKVKWSRDEVRLSEAQVRSCLFSSSCRLCLSVCHSHRNNDLFFNELFQFLVVSVFTLCVALFLLPLSG